MNLDQYRSHTTWGDPICVSVCYNYYIKAELRALCRRNYDTSGSPKCVLYACVCMCARDDGAGDYVMRSVGSAVRDVPHTHTVMVLWELPRRRRRRKLCGPIVQSSI